MLRACWDGEERPSIESPLGDFFGVGHARVSNYWSLPLNMVTGGSVQASSRAAMNCFLPMPYSRQARASQIQNDAKEAAGLYFYVDYEEYESLPARAAFPCALASREPHTSQRRDQGTQHDERSSLRYRRTWTARGTTSFSKPSGRGHYVGCNLSIDHLNPIPNFSWFGEGDDMIFIDGETHAVAARNRDGGLFCTAFGYPSGQASMPYHGISLAGPTEGPEAYSGKWTMYRFHVEDPIQFQKSLRVTIEHGHANVHADDYSSVAYWYQAEPHDPFPPLAPVEKRLPISDVDSLRQFWKTR